MDTTFYYFLSGYAFGVMLIMFILSVSVNLYSIWNYGYSRTNISLLVGDLTIFSFMIWDQVMIYMGTLNNLPTLSLFFTIMIAVVLVYTTLRSQKLVHRYFIRVALFCHFITCIAVYFRGAKLNNIIPINVPYYTFIVFAPFTWICCCYSIYSIGKLIRSNPGSLYDSRQRRLEKISNVVVVLGGGVQLINIGIALTAYSMFCIPLIASTLLLFTLSDILVEVNKFTYIACSEPSGLSRFLTEIKE